MIDSKAPYSLRSSSWPVALLSQRYSGVRSGMAAQLDLPLPELSVENFSRAWTQFELVAAAKQWDEAKQLTILPTLLRERLLDYSVELDTDKKGSLRALKEALMTKAGIAQDPLMAGRALAQGTKVHRREPLTLLPRCGSCLFKPILRRK